MSKSNSKNLDYQTYMMYYDIKEDCHWWKNRSKRQCGCGLLTKLQCKIKGKCSFYETTESFKARKKEADKTTPKNYKPKGKSI